ncbi:hypothetical protein AAC387_Pa04g1477 [Persea americana]
MDQNTLLFIEPAANSDIQRKSNEENRNPFFFFSAHAMEESLLSQKLKSLCSTSSCSPQDPLLREKPISETDSPKKIVCESQSPEKPTLENGFPVEPISKTVFTETHLKTRPFDKFVVETTFLEKPILQTRVVHEEPTSKTESLVNSVPETGCSGKSTSENQFSEKPTSGFGFSETPNLEVYRNVESPSHLLQI